MKSCVAFHSEPTEPGACHAADALRPLQRRGSRVGEGGRTLGVSGASSRGTGGSDRGTCETVAKKRLCSHLRALTVRRAPANAHTATSDASSGTLWSPLAVGNGPGKAEGHSAEGSPLAAS